jgi:hypothetical protein
VPRRARSFGGAVHERPQLIDQQKRVRVSERDISRERAPDLEPGSFDLLVRLNQALDWAIGRLGRIGTRGRISGFSTVIAAIASSDPTGRHDLNLQLITLPA